MSESSTMDTTLKIVRQLDANPVDVYQAFADPQQMKEWMGPGEVSCLNVEIDLRPGGKYRIEMQTTDCETPTAIGEYKEIVPNQRLQFTWSWEGGEMPDTLVTIEFKEKDGGTELILQHDRFPDKETAQKHTEGWNGCLDNLVKYL